jgi:hypothetical protein
MKLSVPMILGPAEGQHVLIDPAEPQLIKVPVPSERTYNLDDELSAFSFDGLFPEVMTYTLKKVGLRGEDGSTITVVVLVPSDREGNLTAWETLRAAREGTVWPSP